MEKDFLEKDFPESENGPITVDKVMKSLTAPDYPTYIAKLLRQVRSWLSQPHAMGDYSVPYWEALREDPTCLFDKLSWLEENAALLPSAQPPKPHAEAIVLSLGEADLTDAMRLAVDYSLIFSKHVCRRVWVITDCWIPFDILEYADHVKAMLENGISLRFLLSTLWGWVELPVSTVGKFNIRVSGFDDRGRGRRRDDD